MVNGVIAVNRIVTLRNGKTGLVVSVKHKSGDTVVGIDDGTGFVWWAWATDVVRSLPGSELAGTA